MRVAEVARLMGRYGLPCWIRSIYYAARFRCLVSPRADIQLSGKIRLGKGTDVRPYARIITRTGDIVLGRRCGVGSFVYIGTGRATITIGDFVRIGAHSYIGAGNREFDDLKKLIMEQEKVEKGIIIEDDVWIGANSVILDGVRIGQGSVIGAGTIVTREIPPLSIAMGNPAKVIRKRGERAKAAGEVHLEDATTHVMKPAEELISPGERKA